MSENDRKRKSKWDNKEENQISNQTNERNAREERESYPDDVMNSRDFSEHPSRDLSPRMRDQRDANRDSSDISRSRRPGDVAKSYLVSPRNHEPGQQNHFRSPERTRDYSHRSSRSLGSGRGRSQSPSGGRDRSRSPSPSRGRERDRGYGRSRSPPNDYRRGPHGPSGGRNRSRSPSGGGNRSRSPSRGRERDRGYGRSGSPPTDYRRDSHGGFNNDRRSGFRGPPPQVCRNFTSGECRRGSQCRFLHPDNPNPRDERDHQPERWGQRGERGGSRYDLEREDLARNRNPNVCNDFLKGRCNRGSSCRFSHDAAGENSHERQQLLAPCKFFMMGNCSRANCRFAHDAPLQGNHEVVPRDDRRNRDHGDMNRSWNGPTWEEADRSASHSALKDGVWNGSTLNDMAGGSDVGGPMGYTGTQNLVKTEPVIIQRNNDGEREKWNGPDSDDVDMEIAGSEAPNEITHSTLDHMHYRTPYEFSKPTSIVTHTEFPENSQLYCKNVEGNVSTGKGFDSVNGGNVHGNQHLDAYNVPPQQFGGMSQGQLVNLHNVDDNGPIQENISQFKVQNSIESQHGVHVNPVTNLSLPQMMEQKPVQISNLPPMSEKFVNEQLPQLYAVLNPDFSTHTQPDQTSIYQKRNSYSTEPKEPDNSNQYQVFSSNSNNNFTNSQPSQEKIVPKPVPEEPSKPIAAEKAQEEAQNNGAGKIEADKKDGDGSNLKDEKAMRLFKNSLVEFVKDILKPKWKEGGMSRDVYKAIVKKVVDKVTGATQGVNIPSTQAKLDQYLESSRPKLAKLVEAYVERYATTS